MVKDNIRKVQEEVTRICARLGRDPKDIVIVAVSKAASVAGIKEAIDAGILNIGENRIQEAVVKYSGLSACLAGRRIPALKWHFVGHLQTNKVKQAVEIFDLIQSVDSTRLAGEIDKQAANIAKIQDILIEVKTSKEATKFGFSKDEVQAATLEISKFKNIKILGFMTIAPAADNPEEARSYFSMLREIRDKINKNWVLSMGMSDDFKIAIEEGSTMVRLGRAIFEGR